MGNRNLAVSVVLIAISVCFGVGAIMTLWVDRSMSGRTWHFLSFGIIFGALSIAWEFRRTAMRAGAPSGARKRLLAGSWIIACSAGAMLLGTAVTRASLERNILEILGIWIMGLYALLLFDYRTARRAQKRC